MSKIQNKYNSAVIVSYSSAKKYHATKLTANNIGVSHSLILLI